MTHHTLTHVTIKTIDLLYNRVPERQFRRCMGQYQTEGEHDVLRRTLSNCWTGLPRDTNHPRNVFLDFDEPMLYAVAHQRPIRQDMDGKHIQVAALPGWEYWKTQCQDRRPFYNLDDLERQVQQDPRHMARHYPLFGSIGYGAEWARGEKGYAVQHQTIQWGEYCCRIVVQLNNRPNRLKPQHLSGLATRHQFLTELAGEHTQVKQTFHHLMRYLKYLGTRPLYMYWVSPHSGRRILGIYYQLRDEHTNHVVSGQCVLDPDHVP